MYEFEHPAHVSAAAISRQANRDVNRCDTVLHRAPVSEVDGIAHSCDSDLVEFDAAAIWFVLDVW
jgi:hypothetical protein